VKPVDSATAAIILCQIIIEIGRTENVRVMYKYEVFETLHVGPFSDGHVIESTVVTFFVAFLACAQCINYYCYYY
jgi:hypothetical protein